MIELSVSFLCGLVVGWIARGYRRENKRDYQIIDRVR
jgi:hypothetical protein